MQRPPRKDQKKKSGRRQAEPDLFRTAKPAEYSTPTAQKFSGTDNPRHLRVIHALMLRPRKREEVDRIAGASNGPELMAELRRRGITKKARRTPGVDRDSRPVWFGVYEMDADDRRAVNAWLRLLELRGKT